MQVGTECSIVGVAVVVVAAALGEVGDESERQEDDENLMV